jgi:hypothetical protein
MSLRLASPMAGIRGRSLRAGVLGARGNQGLPTRGLVARWRLGSPNLLLYSEDITHWATANATVTATTITESVDSSSVQHYVTQVQPCETPQTFSLKAKCGSANRQILFLILGDAGSVFGGAYFNPQTGVVISTKTSGGAPAVSASISPAGDGKYYCQVTFTLPSGYTTVKPVLYLSQGTNDFYQGDGTGSATFEYIQLNQGSTPLPYVKTTDLQTIPDLSGHGHDLTRGSTSGADSNDPTVSTTGLIFDGVDDELTGIPSLGSTYTVINDNGTQIESIDSAGGKYINGAANASAVNYDLGTAGGYSGLAAQRAQYSVVLNAAEQARAYRYLLAQRPHSG